MSLTTWRSHWRNATIKENAPLLLGFWKMWHFYLLQWILSPYKTNNRSQNVVQRRTCDPRNWTTDGGSSVCSHLWFMVMFQEVHATACAIHDWEWQSPFLEKLSTTAQVGMSSATWLLRDFGFIFNSALGSCFFFDLFKLFHLWLLESWHRREHRQKHLYHNLHHSFYHPSCHSSQHLPKIHVLRSTGWG